MKLKLQIINSTQSNTRNEAKRKKQKREEKKTLQTLNNFTLGDFDFFFLSSNSICSSTVYISRTLTFNHFYIRLYY